MEWEATKAHITNTILWQLVSCIGYFSRTFKTDLIPAVSGASATIASDALMNPFDGKLNPSFHLKRPARIDTFQS